MRHACRILQIALFAALCLSGAGAQQGESPGTDPAGALEAGDAAYQRGDFAGARDQYLAAIRQGLDGARVLYNLGNAYYRTGKIGRAIACYERAATLAPRDDDVRANLERALVERPSGAVAPPPTWLHMLGRRLVGSFTLTEFAVCAAVMYCWSWACPPGCC
jgi:tetratricopeptide (TPR) repeat protein